MATFACVRRRVKRLRMAARTCSSATCRWKPRAIIVTLIDNVLDAAKAAKAAVMSCAHLGPQHGVPFTVKDLMDTAGVVTQRGLSIFKGRNFDAYANRVALMKSTGAILVEKTNLREFSRWVESDNSLTKRKN